MENKKKFTFRYIIIAILAVIILTFVRLGIDEIVQSFKTPKLDDSKLEEIAREANEQFPYMLDDETRADEVKALPGKKLAYYYSLVNFDMDEDDFDIDYLIEVIEEEVIPMTIDEIKANSDIKSLRDNKVTFVFVYRDMYGREMASFELTHEDYR